MRSKLFALLLLLVPVLGTAGCGGFFARRMAQAPNTYPAWLAPKAQVELSFSWESLTNFPAGFVDVGPPQARLAYRVVEPADYRVAVSSTNWLERGRQHFRFSLDATLPGRTNAWTLSPRGTVLRLHGYGEAQFAMAPGAAPGGGRLALRVGGPPRTRQIHRTTDLLWRAGGARPEPIAGRAGSRRSAGLSR